MIFILNVLQNKCENLPPSEIPIILIHGFWSTRGTMDWIKERLQRDLPEREIVSIEILTGAFSSVLESSERYIRAAAESVKNAAAGKKCVDLVGHSQGAIVARAYVALSSHLEGFPGVQKMISLAGIQSGFYCSEESDSWCKSFKLQSLPSSVAYSSFGKLFLVPLGYWKDPRQLETYVDSGNLLCRINNECLFEEQVRQNMLSLQKFVLFGSTTDTTLSPATGSLFDFYKVGDQRQLDLIDLKQQKIYTDDLFGLKTLDTQNKLLMHRLKKITHGGFSRHESFYELCLKPYLSDSADANAIKKCEEI